MIVEIGKALQYIAAPRTVEQFRRKFGGDEILEGLTSKGYAEINKDYVELTLPGVRALLDFEGLDTRTGKRKHE